MQKHGGKTPKRTTVYSCMNDIQLLDLGTLTKAERELRAETETHLVRTLVALNELHSIISIYCMVAGDS